MKIVCSGCKSVLGEQRPYKDSSEIEAKCPTCLAAEKEAAHKAIKRPPNPEKEREVVFENGWRGVLSIAGKETEKLSFWDMIVAGRKFSCSEKDMDEVAGILNSLPEDEVDVTFFHSMSIKLDPPDGRRKKKSAEAVEEKKPDDSIQYNCTVRVPKRCVLPMFHDKAERMRRIAEILANAVHKDYQEECKNAVRTSAESLNKVDKAGQMKPKKSPCPPPKTGH
jgi:hypothetical protein